MRVNFSVFNCSNNFDIEQEIDNYRAITQNGILKFGKEQQFFSYSEVSQLNYVFNELKKNGVDKTKFMHYAIRFAYDRFLHDDIDGVIHMQKLYSEPFDDIKKSFGTIVEIFTDNNTTALLQSLGKSLRTGNMQQKYPDYQFGFEIVFYYVFKETDKFIEFINSNKLMHLNANLNIYWSLRFKKIKEDFLLVDVMTFEQAFNMFLLDKQLPTVSSFKQEYLRVKNNYVSISTVLKNWKRKNKKLLSCYINDDEKQYLEYMLLSNSVNYEELKKFIYGK